MGDNVDECQTVKGRCAIRFNRKRYKSGQKNTINVAYWKNPKNKKPSRLEG